MYLILFDDRVYFPAKNENLNGLWALLTLLRLQTAKYWTFVQMHGSQIPDFSKKSGI
jgi:hypothetical protein